MHRTLAAFALLLTCALVGCDSTPSDPLDPRTDLAAVLAPNASTTTGLSLPGLVHAAVHRTWTEQGPGAARGLVADLRRLQQAHAAVEPGAHEAAAVRLQALRSEELRIVLRVFGESIVPRVNGAVLDEALRTERAIAVAAAEPAGRARALLDDAFALIDAAEAASARRAWLDALDAGTRAASVLGAARSVLEAEQRVAGLEELFAQAVARLEAGAAGSAASALERHAALRHSLAAPAGSADSRRLHASLKAQRDEQIGLVLQVLGTDVAGQLIGQAHNARADLDRALVRAQGRGLDVLRLERMSDSAHDMLNRAAASLEAGDAATALDLASHAAGLVNAARSAIAY